MSELWPPSVPIADQHVLLRPVTVDDVTDAYCKWLNDPVVTRQLETRFQPQTRESILAYVSAQRRSRDAVLLAIVWQRELRHVGNVRIGAIDRHHRTATVALMIGERHAWGHGVGTSAISLATRYAFEHLELVKLTARCYATNLASIRAFEKAGWRHEGQQRSQFVSDGRRIDGIWLGIAAE